MIVVGAGPAGVICAYRLALAGVDVLVLEAEAQCPEDMRASTFHPPTLDMMAELGLIDTLEAQGLRAPEYHYRNRATGEVLAFDFGELAGESAHPYRLQCEQFKLTRLVAGLLAGHPHADLRFSRRAVAHEDTGDGVLVRAQAPHGLETYRADFLIGADGASSTIRKGMEIGFDGFTYPEKFLTLSTAYPVERAFDRLAQVNYMTDSKEWCVLLRVPQFWRVLVPASVTESDEALTSDAKKIQVFDGLTGNGADIVTHHRTIYRVHQRVAETFRRGRAILVGDAAHLNNPLGGLGMNSGIHDAWNLTEKLVEILQHRGDAEALLDRYDRQRRTVMHEFVQAQTIRNKQMLESSVAEDQKRFQQELAAIQADPVRRREYLLRQSMYLSREREAAIL